MVAIAIIPHPTGVSAFQLPLVTPLIVIQIRPFKYFSLVKPKPLSG